MLDGLNSIQLEPIDLSTLSSNDETVTRTILIPNDAKNVSGRGGRSPSAITIHGKQIKTLRTTNIVFIGVDEEKFKATSLSQQVQVTIRADAADAQKILAGNIRIVADMSGYTQEGTYQVPVSVYVDGYDSAGAIGQYSIAANLAPAHSGRIERKERNVIRSMTGYGRAEKTIDGREITVEMRAVNNRYLDLNVKLPRVYGFAEDAVKSLIKANVNRGKLDLFITVNVTADTSLQISLNKPVLEGYLAALKSIAADYGVRDDISVTALSRMPDVFVVEKQEEDEQKLTDDILSVVKEALAKFNAMREKEGAAMEADLRSRAKTVLSLVEKVEAQKPRHARGIPRAADGEDAGGPRPDEYRRRPYPAGGRHLRRQDRRG